MLTWLVQRLLTSLVLVLLVVTAVFFVVRLAPGDPLDQVVEERLGPQEREFMRQRYGLDRPLPQQYLQWLGDLARGDFGVSLDQQRPVGDILAETIPATLLLTVSAYALHLVLALAAGLVMAWRRGSWADHLVQGIGLTFYSMPGFWLGLMAIMLLSRQLGWFPVGGMHAADAAFMSHPIRLLDLLHHLALPVLTLALGSFMGTARYLRSSLEEALNQDYILAARSRGISEGRILMHHALRNALLPVITLMGLSIPFLLGGAVVTEVVFGWPGMGRVTVDAIWTRDYPVIMATTLVAALTVVAGSLLADILYTRADPRVAMSDPGEAVVRGPGLIITLVLLVVAVLAPLLAPGDPSALGETSEALQAPSSSHLLGTDVHGRDLLTRLIHGSRVSLLVGWVSVLVAVFLGTVLGLGAGLGPRWLDSILMRTTDVFLAFPRIFLVLLLISLTAPSLTLVMLVLGLTGWMGVARLVRAEALSLRERDFVRAARGLGLTPWRVAWRHVLPNLLPTVIVAASLRVGGAILTESFLSFLGLGAQEPAVSWGAMIQQGRQHLLDAWWITTFPGLAIIVTVIGYNLLGDELRRRLDPQGADFVPWQIGGIREASRD